MMFSAMLMSQLLTDHQCKEDGSTGTQYTKSSIHVSGQELKSVDNFTYLGNTLAKNANIDTEINRQGQCIIRQAQEECLGCRGLSLGTKLKVYNAVVITSILYGCGIMTIFTRHARKLIHFHDMCCLSKLLHIKLQDTVLDTEFLSKPASTLCIPCSLGPRHDGRNIF